MSYGRGKYGRGKYKYQNTIFININIPNRTLCFSLGIDESSKTGRYTNSPFYIALTNPDYLHVSGVISNV